MPGSVETAVPTGVMPWSLCRAFTRLQQYPIIENEYPDGSSQRGVLASESAKRWVLVKRLTPSQLQDLRDFCDARRGQTEAFYFYDPWETSPKFSHDPSGQAMAGRYVVRFGGAWSQDTGIARSDVPLELVEIM